MNFQPKTHTLKTGGVIVVRVPEVEEALELVERLALLFLAESKINTQIIGGI